MDRLCFVKQKMKGPSYGTAKLLEEILNGK